MSTSVPSFPAQPPQIFELFVDADTAAAFLGITRRTLLQKDHGEGRVGGSRSPALKGNRQPVATLPGNA